MAASSAGSSSAIVERLEGTEWQKARSFCPAVVTEGGRTVWLAGQTTLVDVSDPNPWNFVFVAHWHTPYARLGSELSNTRVSQYPCMMHAKALMSEYFMARERATPLYHEIEQLIFGISRHYRRLILPLADTDNRVNKLVVGVRSVRPPFQVKQNAEIMLMN